MPARTATDGRSDFDFTFGEWTIRNRKLRSMTDPECDEWFEFASRSSTEPILRGFSHLERIWGHEPSPVGEWEGLTLRQYDPAADVWSIWWASTRRPGHLDPPLTGRFAGPVGHFHGEDVVGDIPIEVQFIWADLGEGRAEWTQAFRFPGREDWTRNWVMTFTRSTSSPAPSAPSS